MRSLSLLPCTLLGLTLALAGCDKTSETPAANSVAVAATSATASTGPVADSPPSPDKTPKDKTPTPDPLGDLAIDWIALDGGAYNMEMDNEAHTDFPVSLKPFEMSKAEVTNAQYAKCVEADVCTPVSIADCTDNAKKAEKLSGPSQPVVCVDWAQAMAFSKWVGGTLPTEAQWAFAATNGEASTYPWGEAKPSCKLAVMNWGCRSDASMDVCSKPLGNTKAGICDMAGNVSELMADVAGWDPETAKRGTKINRGGSWHGIDPLYYKNSPKGESLLRVSHRSRYGANMREDSMGFRPVRVPAGDDGSPPPELPKAG